MRIPLRRLLPVNVAVLLPFLFPSGACAEVIVHDLVAVQGEKALIRVETRGKFFSRGGKVVELFINDRAAGRILSGGDGFAFRQYTPGKTGIQRITARSGADEASGLLLSLRKGTGIVFVEAEGGLLEGPFSKEPRKGSKEALGELSRRFPVVFLSSGMTGTVPLKAWLKEKGFPALPVVPWDQGNVFEDARRKGLVIRAVIGSPEIIESAGEYHPRAFSFTDAEGATQVKDWEELRKLLVSGGF